MENVLEPQRHAFRAAGSAFLASFPASEIWMLGSWAYAPEIRRWSWDDVTSRTYPKMAIPWEAPDFLTCDIFFSNTITNSADYRQGRCGGSFSECWKVHEPGGLTVNGHSNGLKVRHCALESAEFSTCCHRLPGLWPFFFEMSQGRKSECLLSTCITSLRGTVFRCTHAFCLPRDRQMPGKIPKFHIIKAVEYLFFK